MQYTILNLYNPKSDSLPEFDLSCKFVLIQNESEVFMVFGSMSKYQYHANLAARFCELKNVMFHWLKKPDLIEILDNSHQIKGGGMIRLISKSKRVEFGGYSTAYGKYDSALLEQFVHESGHFQGFEVLIGT